MGYASTADVRMLCGFTVDEVNDTDLQYYIDKATNLIIEHISIPRIDEELSGSIDGINTTFNTSYCPIADTDGDTDVDSGDLTVYGWTDSDDPSTKSTLSVQRVYARDGIIVLSSAPSVNIEKITCDYNYTLEENIPWDLVKIACSYLTGFLFIVKEWLLIPDSYSLGAIRFKHTRPYLHYLEQYYNIMSMIKTKVHVKSTTETIEVLRERMA